MAMLYNILKFVIYNENKPFKNTLFIYIIRMLYIICKVVKADANRRNTCIWVLP